ncbi:MAG: amidase family protein [Chloroflexi bacterium]|nr:amidase family protein [Chloroflexota bacterium]
MSEICWLSAVELIDAYKKKKFSPLEVVQSQLERIAKINPKLNAFVTLVADLALIAARESAKRYQDGVPGALDGVPVAIKDNTFTKGIRTTDGSKLYEDFVPDKDAVLVSRLKDAGAIILGKTNLPEFGLVGITDNVLFGKTLNPWNLSRTSGGSSGGSAAAVAAGLCPIAQGNDGGGSIRIPSSFCGVFGLKPTYGRVPYYPHIPGWETINHEGPITRTVEDAALMLDVMAGPSIYDQNSLPEYPGKFREDMKGNIRGMRIAYSSDLGAGLPVDREVLEMTMKAAFSFREMGCHVDEIKPGWISMEGAFLTTVLSETYTALFSQMEKYKSVAYPPYLPFMDFAGTFTNRDLIQVQFDRQKLTCQAAEVFEKYDLLLTPTTAVTAFEAGPLGPAKINGHEGSPSNWVSFTFTFNFLGQPAASIPCGFNSEGLPVGLQIVGRRFDEALVLRAAAAYEKAHPWAHKKPGL